MCLQDVNGITWNMYQKIGALMKIVTICYVLFDSDPAHSHQENNNDLLRAVVVYRCH